MSISWPSVSAGKPIGPAGGKEAGGKAPKPIGDFWSSIPPVPERTPPYAVHPYQRFVPLKVKTFVDFLANRYGKGYDWTRYESS